MLFLWYIAFKMCKWNNMLQITIASYREWYIWKVHNSVYYIQSTLKNNMKWLNIFFHIFLLKRRCLLANIWSAVGQPQSGYSAESQTRFSLSWLKALVSLRTDIDVDSGVDSGFTHVLFVLHSVSACVHVFTHVQFVCQVTIPLIKFRIRSFRRRQTRNRDPVTQMWKSMTRLWNLKMLLRCIVWSNSSFVFLI